MSDIKIDLYFIWHFLSFYLISHSTKNALQKGYNKTFYFYLLSKFIKDRVNSIFKESSMAKVLKKKEVKNIVKKTS